MGAVPSGPPLQGSPHLSTTLSGIMPEASGIFRLAMKPVENSSMETPMNLCVHGNAALEVEEISTD
jgi:hypothetical protein